MPGNLRRLQQHPSTPIGGGLQLADFTWSSVVYESSGQGLLQGRLTSLGCSLGCGPDGTPPVMTVAEPASTSLLTLGLMCAWLGRRRAYSIYEIGRAHV